MTNSLLHQKPAYTRRGLATPANNASLLDNNYMA